MRLVRWTYERHRDALMPGKGHETRSGKHAGSHPAPKNTALGFTPKVEPVTHSWWLGLDREAFRQQAHAEQPRLMRQSNGALNLHKHPAVDKE